MLREQLLFDGLCIKAFACIPVSILDAFLQLSCSLVILVGHEGIALIVFQLAHHLQRQQQL